MQKINITIKGVSPLLMHQFSGDERARVQDGGQIVTTKTPQSEAESGAYRLPGNGKPGNLYIPAENLRQALVTASAYEKGRGRSSLAKFSAAAIFVSPDALDLGTAKYEVDSRAVVIQATKGRIIRHRPLLDQWSVDLFCEFDETLLTETQIRAIFDHAGTKVGLLDFRPAKRGLYGRFMVTHWEPVK